MHLKSGQVYLSYQYMYNVYSFLQPDGSMIKNLAGLANAYTSKESTTI